MQKPISVQDWLNHMKPGMTVISRGHPYFFTPQGIEGRILRIEEPYANGRTEDVIVVKWKGWEGEWHMKVKDIDLFLSFPQFFPRDLGFRPV